MQIQWNAIRDEIFHILSSLLKSWTEETEFSTQEENFFFSVVSFICNNFNFITESHRSCAIEEELSASRKKECFRWRWRLRAENMQKLSGFSWFAVSSSPANMEHEVKVVSQVVLLREDTQKAQWQCSETHWQGRRLYQYILCSQLFQEITC